MIPDSWRLGLRQSISMSKGFGTGTKRAEKMRKGWCGVTIEELRILSKEKSQDYKNGWNDAVKMCNKEGTMCPELKKYIFESDSEDYKAGFARAYAVLENFIKQTIDENQRLREIQDKHEGEKAYVRKRKEELDILVEKEKTIAEIARMLVDKNLIDHEYYRQKNHWDEEDYY